MGNSRRETDLRWGGRKNSLGSIMYLLNVELPRNLFGALPHLLALTEGLLALALGHLPRGSAPPGERGAASSRAWNATPQFTTMSAPCTMNSAWRPLELLPPSGSPLPFFLAVVSLPSLSVSLYLLDFDLSEISHRWHFYFPLQVIDVFLNKTKQNGEKGRETCP